MNVRVKGIGLTNWVRCNSLGLPDLEVREGLWKKVVFTLRPEGCTLRSSRWIGPQKGEWSVQRHRRIRAHLVSETSPPNGVWRERKSVGEDHTDF